MGFKYYQRGLPKPDENGKIRFQQGYISFFKVAEQDFTEFNKENPEAIEITDEATLKMAKNFLGDKTRRSKFQL